MSTLLIQHVRTLYSLYIIIPKLNNPTKDIDKKIYSHVENPTKIYADFLNIYAIYARWEICLHPWDWPWICPYKWDPKCMYSHILRLIGYSPDLNFSSLCVDYKYFTNVRVINWNVVSYYFLACSGENFHLHQFT